MSVNVFEGLCPSCKGTVFVKVRNELTTYSLFDIERSREKMRKKLEELEAKGELDSDAIANKDLIINSIIDENDIDIILENLKGVFKDPKSEDKKDNKKEDKKDDNIKKSTT